MRTRYSFSRSVVEAADLLAREPGRNPVVLVRSIRYGGESLNLPQVEYRRGLSQFNVTHEVDGQVQDEISQSYLGNSTRDATPSEALAITMSLWSHIGCLLARGCGYRTGTASLIGLSRYP